jgi:hypothetical protein
VSAAEGEALGEWIAREGATQTIEIGLGYGISVLFIGEALLASGNESALHVVLDPTRRRDSPTAACSFWTTQDWRSWWSFMPSNRKSRCRDSWLKNGASTLPSWTATTASTGSFST